MAYFPARAADGFLPLATLPAEIVSAISSLPIEFSYSGICVGYIQEDADRQAALALVRAALKPGLPDEIDQELVRLRHSTAARQETIADLAMQYEIYNELCAEYPGYVVRDGLRYLGRTEKWFPTLAEVNTELKHRADKIRMLSDALEHPERHRRSPPPPPVLYPDWALATKLVNLIVEVESLEELDKLEQDRAADFRSLREKSHNRDCLPSVERALTVRRDKLTYKPRRHPDGSIDAVAERDLLVRLLSKCRPRDAADVDRWERHIEAAIKEMQETDPACAEAVRVALRAVREKLAEPAAA